MSFGNSSKWHCFLPTCPAGKSSMWLTQSVDLNKARAYEESCSDIRRGSSVLWAEVWVTSSPTSCAQCAGQGPSPSVGAPQREGSGDGHSLHSVRSRTTTCCQILPYFLPVPMLKFNLQKFESMSSVLQSSPLEMKRKQAVTTRVCRARGTGPQPPQTSWHRPSSPPE